MADDIVKDRQPWTSAPYFIVDDVVGTANYYRDKLGFHYERFWNDPPSFCMVKRNGRKADRDAEYAAEVESHP